MLSVHLLEAMGLSVGREALLSEKKRGEGEREKRKQADHPASTAFTTRKTLTDIGESAPNVRDVSS